MATLFLGNVSYIIKLSSTYKPNDKNCNDYNKVMAVITFYSYGSVSQHEAYASKGDNMNILGSNWNIFMLYWTWWWWGRKGDIKIWWGGAWSPKKKKKAGKHCSIVYSISTFEIKSFYAEKLCTGLYS